MARSVLLEVARGRCERAPEAQQSFGFGPGRSNFLSSVATETFIGLGTVAELLGDGEEALRFHQRGLDLAITSVDPQGIASALEGLAGQHPDRE